jgi:hypothetical protein
MKGTLEAFTLDLDPSVPSSLDVITANRSGVATFTDANGVIQSASANTVRVDHTQGAELTPTVFQNVGNTDFSSNWSHYLSNSSVQSETLNGQPILRWTTTGNTAQLKHSINTEEGKNYTYSFFVRSVSNGGGNGFRAWSQNSPINNHSVINLDSNFQKIVVTFSGKVGGGNVSIGLVELGTHTIDNVLEYSTPQVVDGEIEYDFVANTTGSPKFITGATFGPRSAMILVEPSATNTIRWSESSSAYNYGSGITFASSDILAPNGQSSAFKMTPDGSNNTNRGGSSYSGFYNTNDVVTMSVWLKTDGYDYFLRVGGFFGSESALFDSLDGSLKSTEGNVISASSEDYGNGWFRYKITYTFQNTINNRYLYAGVRLAKRDASNNPVELFDGTGETTGVLVYGTQFELGSVATSYIPTDNDVSGVTRAADNLSIDPDSTNLVTHSDFSGGWQEYLINSSAGSGYSLNASRVITSTGANAAYYIPVPTSNGATYTASIWARRVSGSGGCNIIYLSSPTAKQSISLTSEFQKFTATFTGKSGGGNVNFGVDIVTSGDSIEIAMPQVELGSSPTGFIPTSGAPASRTAFTDFFSSSEGTFYAEYQFNDADGANSLIYGSADNQRFAYKNLGSSSPLLSYDGVNVLNYGRLAAGTLLRTALSYNSNTMEGSQDGSAATMSNQTAPFPHTGNFLTASKLHIGSDTNGGKQLNGHIKRLLFWPYHSDSL